MEWKKLLSEKRIGKEARSGGKKDLRSEFEKDYHRIILSSSFRRLQDKTQVFPLDKSDFIRTRLTHSLEVSSIGRSLAGNIAASLIEMNADPGFGPKEAAAITDILQCAGLIHDIGNPPFGHFGEESIREWFQNNLESLQYKGHPVTGLLTRQQLEDLKHFEGNAQGLRMVGKLDYPVRLSGMNLTCGLMSAMIKYPVSSVEADSASQDSGKRKPGYFQAEEQLFRMIASETGCGKKRNPLALILEAADDIAYATADIEDAFKKGFFDYPALLEELQLRRFPKSCIVRLSDNYDLARLNSVSDPDEFAVRCWIREMQELLILGATESFTGNYQSIMDGSFKKELLCGRTPHLIVSVLKSIAYDYAFTSSSIFRTEIAAFKMLTELMNMIVPAALIYDSGIRPGLMEEKYLSLIPGNYKQVFLRNTAGMTDEQKVYHRILLATDTISGMTDSHARDLYAELNGI